MWRRPDMYVRYCCWSSCIILNHTDVFLLLRSPLAHLLLFSSLEQEQTWSYQLHSRAVFRWLYWSCCVGSWTWVQNSSIPKWTATFLCFSARKFSGDISVPWRSREEVRELFFLFLFITMSQVLCWEQKNTCIEYEKTCITVWISFRVSLLK